MRLVIVGATPVGRALARLSSESGHEVWLVERDREKAEGAAGELDARVVHADIADADVAGEVEMEGAAAVVAVTSDDSDNLMAMVLAGEASVSTRVSVVNEKTHRRMFERIGVQVLEDPEAVLADHLYGLVLHPRARRFHAVAENEWIFEVEVGAGSKVAGRSVGALGEEKLLPEGMTLLRVYSDGNNETARDVQPDTRIEVGDRLLVLTTRSVRDDELDPFTG